MYTHQPIGVFQIACHEDIIPIEEPVSLLRNSKRNLQGDNGVGRVIARPFVGSNGHYTRTERRKDFSLPPIAPTLLDYVSKAGLTVSAVGKIEDIFCNRGITQSVHTHTNAEGIEQTIKYIENAPDGLIFTNLVDTDMLYGHRNDVEGFGKSLQYFDDKLPRIINAMSMMIYFLLLPTTVVTQQHRQLTIQGNMFSSLAMVKILNLTT